VVLLISLLIFNDLSFDGAFKEGKNIYRINSKLTAFMPGETLTATANALGPAIQEAIPEVIAAVRTHGDDYNVQINNHLMQIRVVWADKDFFRLFDTPFLHGTPDNVMSKPNAIAISEQMAETLFGNSNPIGETFSLDDQHLMEVVAIYKDYPANSSFKEHKIIAPFMHSYPAGMHERIHWRNMDYETFCLLGAKTNTESVNAQMRKTLSDATEGIMEGGWFCYPELQRLEDIHLYSAKYQGRSYTSSQSDIEKVKLLSALSVIILLVACINYMNLSTARAQKRSKEIGVSKTLGAKRIELIVRFTLETAIFTFVSFVAAFILASLLLPIFNSLLGVELSFGLLLQPLFLCTAMLIWIITTLLTASYPAIYLSGFPPLMAIRRQFSADLSHVTVRKALSVGQFAIAIVLIAWVLVIQAQIIFVNNRNLGYNPRNLISMEVNAQSGSEVLALVNDFRSESSVETVTRQTGNFFNGSGNTIMKNEYDQMGMTLTTITTDADPNFIDLMQMKLIAGRQLPDQQGDSIVQIILNRAAVDYLEMTPEEAIGKRVHTSLVAPVVEVCGVMENFFFESLHRSVSGFGIHNMNDPKRTITLRVKDGNMPEQLITYEQIFRKHFPNQIFKPVFHEQEVANAYAGDKRTGRIAVVFSMLAIFIACMGVFGLTAFMAEQRTKEIGIRKTLGASVGDILGLSTGSYVKLLLISLVIAIPAAWWIGDRYLQDFAYRISLSWWMFVLAALTTVALTLLTVSMQTNKAATANPVKAIKSE
jgi:ABC-type antimicrobial peptide transport system permease subunit